MHRMTEDGSMAQLCTYARIDTVELPLTGDLMDCWEEPASFFLISGAAQECLPLFQACPLGASIGSSKECPSVYV